MNVMLSYKSEDYEAVKRILAGLIPHKVEPWVDTEGIKPGEPWREVLLEELRTCDVCVPVLSKAYASSEHCRMEVFIARSLGRRIVPVMLEDCFSELRLYEETKGLEDILMDGTMLNCSCAGPTISRTADSGPIVTTAIYLLSSRPECA